jgi:RimJ/RimL family protein N-acetyltransferase
VCCIALDYVFSRLSARKICCKVRCANSASYRMLLGVGFRLEGTARKHEYNWQAGEYSDCYFLGLLRSEYPGPFTAKALNRITYEER